MNTAGWLGYVTPTSRVNRTVTDSFFHRPRLSQGDRTFRHGPPVLPHPLTLRTSTPHPLPPTPYNRKHLDIPPGTRAVATNPPPTRGTATSNGPAQSRTTRRAQREAKYKEGVQRQNGNYAGSGTSPGSNYLPIVYDPENLPDPALKNRDFRTLRIYTKATSRYRIKPSSYEGIHNVSRVKTRHTRRGCWPASAAPGSNDEPQCRATSRVRGDDSVRSSSRGRH